MKTPISFTSLLLLSTSFALSTTTAPQFQCTPSPTLPHQSIDIAILGGGASGTFSAIHLQNKHANQTLALIEAKPKLGGQVNTYHDPSTGLTAEYGVNQYTDVPGAAEFLDALGIPYTRSGTRGGDRGGGSGYIDIQNGRILDGPSEEEGNETAKAIRVYREILGRYPELEEGFLLPEPVPEDLVLPFTELARKYGIERAVLPLSTGMGDLDSVPTLYVMKHYGTHVYRNRFLYTARKNNQEIYDKAQQLLGESALLSSKPLAIQRNENNNSVQICLQTPTGTQLLHAKRLLVTIPPTLNSLKGTGLDLTPEETALFANFSRIGYYSTLVHIPGFLPFLSFQQNSTDKKNNITVLENTYPANSFNLPQLPAIWNIHRTSIPDLYHIEYGTATPLSEDIVKQNIFTDLARLRNTGLIITIDNGSGTDVQEDPVVVRFADHSPFYPYLSPEAIKDGFYKRLAKLQGERGTWWTGGAFHVPDSSLLWRFSEGVVAGLVKSIEEGG
ncbi:uncharacterized protein ASPGLDRAFT_66905 [Aspergillus glaucus CBS 516.65]|uniref:Amine oxidase domain-containing protein n=1 Tax=Aspergillus glaucus CBS 516.65 TaxID=1160497 RepID=A0A1L9VJA3_ASPGL|nr:hypothetical protein ASPGLDRAFT_66905 [Aspergillus glaucus CBS 516.65]OJJ83955.1 hypothetical protein ASPGLDRAFT_66905 [Aspergillus glaucus CBS 516.65]